METVDAYWVLEGIIQEDGLCNPYAQLLFHDPTSKDIDPFNEYLEVYLQGNKIQNTMGMEEWSIFGTKMTYPQVSHPDSLLFIQNGPESLLTE